MPAGSLVLCTGLTRAPSEIASMSDHVAKCYDPMNLIITGGMDHVWMKASHNTVASLLDKKVLDMTVGAGIFYAMLAGTGAEVIACDLSEGVVEIGYKRHPDVGFIQGNMAELSLKEAPFDIVTISWGLRNIPDLELALKEMTRVVRPKGRLVVYEFSTLPNPLFRSLYECCQSSIPKYLVKALSSDETAYDCLVESIHDQSNQRTVGGIVARNDWVSVEYRNLTGGIAALHWTVKPLP